MKRLIASVGLLLIIACYLWSCEKDDICTGDTVTTPSMVINFYNKDNTAAPREVTGLKYFVEGSDKTILIPGSVTSIRVPLPVDATSVKWGFTLTTTTSNVTRVNTDFLEFKYTNHQEYVSRACGFKNTFILEASTPVVRNPLLTQDGNLWISDYTVENREIILENVEEPHVKIYF